jgi:hypothetical protein
MDMSALVDDRNWRRRRWASFGVALAMIVVMIPVSQARAESLGCIMLNTISDAGGELSFSQQFEAGELITVDVSSPSDGAASATLFAGPSSGGLAAVDTNSVPGTLRYTVADTGSLTVSARVDTGSADFSFSCSLDSGDPGDTGDTTTTVPPTGDSCGSGKEFGKSVSAAAKDGAKKGEEAYKPGSHKGFSSCRHGDADSG